MSNLKRITITALLVICVAAPGTAAAAAGGKRYHDATRSDGTLVALAFSRDGKQITRAFVSFFMQCSDGDSFTQSFTLDRIRVDSNGRFKYIHESGPVPNETGTEMRELTLSITGRRTGPQVTGTVRAVFRQTVSATGATVTCDSKQVRYIAVD